MGFSGEQSLAGILAQRPADESEPLEVRLYGDPVLRRRARPIADLTPEIRQLAQRMMTTMMDEEAPGIGLAATQVGIELRLITLATVSNPFELPPTPSPGECLLCPRQCTMADAERGWCGVRPRAG